MSHHTIAGRRTYDGFHLRFVFSRLFLVKNSKGSERILPNSWLFSMHSRAVRVSFKGNVWSIDAECTEGTVSQGKAVVQESGNIACALGYSHNLDGLGRGAIDDEVSAHRPEQNRVSGQVLAPMAYAG
jgi:hypothetical protein